MRKERIYATNPFRCGLRLTGVRDVDCSASLFDLSSVTLSLVTICSSICIFNILINKLFCLFGWITWLILRSIVQFNSQCEFTLFMQKEKNKTNLNSFRFDQFTNSMFDLFFFLFDYHFPLMCFISIRKRYYREFFNFFDFFYVFFCFFQLKTKTSNNKIYTKSFTLAC